jgi:SAM-dependent methyltransferase
MAQRKHPIDYSNARVRREILVRQRRGLWTPEQVESLARHFRLRPGMKLLDAGCGYGYALRTWGRFCLPGGRLTGLDCEARLLAAAGRQCRRERMARATRFVAGDITAMPLPDDEFDVAIAHVVFCHLAEPELALDEMIRVVRPGGCVAVFDNAVGAGAGGGWSSWYEPTIRARVQDCEFGLRLMAGRKRLGLGDYAVAGYLPGWMEGRGLEDVGVRTNERVFWIAPPYRSSEQLVAYRNTKERLKEKRMPELERQASEQWRAGGVTDRQLAEFRRRGRNAGRRFERAMKNGTAAYAWSGPFWCVWGFKPGGRKQ